MKKFIKKLYSNVLKNPYVILFSVTFLIMIPYIFSNKYIKGNDTDFHMSNIFSIYTSIKQGTLSNILPIIAHDFGYASRIFYPRLAHFSTALITLVLNGNVIWGLKIIHFIVYFLSAVMMYKLVNKIFKNKFSALISAIFYLSFPYMLTEVFVRDSLAESLIFIFMPMIMLGIYELFYGDKKYFYLWFILGYVGIINSHLVLAVYFTAFIFIYLLLNIKKVFKKENIKSLVFSSIIILLLTATFTVPILQHKSLKIYTVFEGDSMTNRGTIVNSAMGIKDFFKQEPCGKFSNITYYLNILGFILAIGTILFNKKIFKETEQKNFFKFILFATIICTFLMSKLCPWIILPKTFVMIQFAWRLESVLLLCLSILAGLAFKNFNRKIEKIIILIIVLLFNGYTVYNAYNFDIFENRNMNDIDVSISGMGWEREYLPMATQKNKKYFDKRNNDILVISGNAEISILENNTPSLKAEITNCKDETVIELPRIYYLGYEAILTENGNAKKLDLYMNDKGFVETKINSNGTLVLKYKGTKEMQLANIVSYITLFGILGYLLVGYIKKKRNT